MELRQLKYFTCLYEEGSVTKAAQRLNIVQPALSMQIAKLEEELGQPLFERTPKGMTPTEAGVQAYRLFMPILGELLEARQTLIDRSGEIGGRINAGLIASAANQALASTLAYFVEHHPDVELQVSYGYSQDLIDRVLSGALDFAVINQSFQQEHLHRTDILDEELLVATGATTRLRQPTPIPLSALAGLKLVLPSRRHGLRMVIDQALAAQSLELTPHLELDDLTVIESFLRRSDWISVLPATVLQRGLEEGALRAYPLAPPGITRRMVCVHDSRRPLTPAATLFIDIISKTLATALNAIHFYKEGAIQESDHDLN
ncbi:MAG: LysR family transcriptional regulator [Pseudomonas sp.]|uniref:LysR family transcriptional regulator n=1 Tax=Pseudomonadota TaxID=1224 RepID=UPI00117A985F|nr:MULTISPECIES: LysR family transcriptional regulator [Pseudomonadota]MPS91987.1 LysR family transcriptional regulator [Comamonas sp.]MPT17168.1 LysR family transcriptional regulator [Pseudomonas sp.]TRO29932.1 LysR family transcriptional regulator [Pseudomonas putida]WJH57927.1 LysR family transcriptional regulator [Pseudomonas guguanensis]